MRRFPDGWMARRRLRLDLRRTLLAGLLVSCLLALAGGWVGLRGWQAKEHLATATDLARELSRQALAGDRDHARRTLAALQQQVSAARSRTGDPIWRSASHLPVAGENLAAGHELVDALDDLVRRALPTLVELDLAALLPRSGRMDVAALRAAASRVGDADATVARIRARLDGVETARLWPALRDAVGQLRAELTRLASLTAAVRAGGALLPVLLGAEGRRTYLLVFQNLAEPRSTGGIFGAHALVRASEGKVTILSQGPATQLGMFQRPVLPLSAESRAVYTDLPGRYPADVNLTPHFPTAASLYREMYRRKTGASVDGVLATDPVALSYLLRALGPVATAGEPTLTAATAVRVLLSDSYRTIESPQAQDRYFASAARAVFDTLLRRPVQPRAMAEAVSAAVAEGRILFWSAHPAEQQEIARTRLAGVLPEREDVPTVGVFLNDGSGSKLGYYLGRAVDLAVGGCRADGRRELRLRLALTSTAPKSGLSPTVLGMGLAGDPYTTRVVVYLFGPARGFPLSARLDGGSVPMGGGTERGRRVGVLGVDVPAGRTRVLEVALLTPVTSIGTARLWLTPGPSPWTTRITSAPSCDR